MGVSESAAVPATQFLIKSLRDVGSHGMGRCGNSISAVYFERRAARDPGRLTSASFRTHHYVYAGRLTVLKPAQVLNSRPCWKRSGHSWTNTTWSSSCEV